jgi:Kef-type K+ transport system membrane component KefB
MEAQAFLIQLVLILFLARAAAEAAARMRIPPVLGELAAGILIGPSLLGLIELSAPVQLLAQIGIILLLFEVGLETDVKHLTSSGVHALVVAICGVLLPFALGFGISYYAFHLSSLISFFIGSTLTATSIGITLRVLRDLGRHQGHEAHIVIGAAVLDDILGIVLLAVLYEFATSGTIDLWHAGKILVFIILFFFLSPLAAKCVSQTIKKWDEASTIPGLLPTTIVSLILLFAWIAHQLGAPELLGGFAAGLALSRQFSLPLPFFSRQAPEFSHRVEEKMKPIIHLFTPVFFVSVGLSLDLRAVHWASPFIWWLTGSLLAAAIAGKAVAGLLVSKASGRTRWIIGVSMIPRGEVGLIFANVGLVVGVLQQDVYASLVLVIALTTLAAPLALRWLCRPAASGKNLS